MTFNFEQFMKENMLKGLHDGSFSPTKVNVMAGNSLMNGTFSQDTFNDILNEVQAYVVEQERLEVERQQAENEAEEVEGTIV